MSDIDAWDAEDFEPELPSLSGSASKSAGIFDDKWEGEDEDDNSKPKDNWEDEDEEESKPKPESSTDGETQAYQRPKKKSVAERLAEKQAHKQKEKEEKVTREKEEKRELSAEEKLTEKIKLQKIQENDSLNLARGLFGEQERSLDGMLPSTEEEFNQFADALKSKITFFEDSQYYQACVSKLISDLAVGLGVEDVKKLGVQMNSLYHEKERQRKETEKKKKKKSKATIKVDRADDFDLISDATGGGAYYEDDDFI